MKIHQWRRGALLGLFFVIICFLPAARGEQATVTYVEGEGYIQRAEEVDWRALAAEESLLEGDQLWTGRGGRMEVTVPEALLIRMDFDTQIELLDLDFSLHLRLKKGRLSLKRSGRPVDFRHSRVEAGPFEIDLSSPSIVRLDRSDRGIQLSVLKGEAEVFGEKGSVKVRDGQTLHLEGDSLSEPSRWERSSFDEFDFFSEQRDLIFAQSTPFPDGERGEVDLSTLDSYGEWVTLPTDGRVFRPFVTSAWRPFLVGEWIFTEHGWTWFSHEPWGTIPHHFGRWVWVSTVGWCWVPGSVWSPAWVVWVVIGDHLAWAPIGTSIVTIETHLHFWNVAHIHFFQTGRVIDLRILTVSHVQEGRPHGISGPQSPRAPEQRVIPLRPPLHKEVREDHRGHERQESVRREGSTFTRPEIREEKVFPQQPLQRGRPPVERREGPGREGIREGSALIQPGIQEEKNPPQQPQQSHRDGSRHGRRGPQDRDRTEGESNGKGRESGERKR